MNFSKDLYEHGIFSDGTIEDIRDYMFAKEQNNTKEKDDFDIEI